MKVVLGGSLAAATLFLAFSGMASPPAHSLKIIARDRPSCGAHLLRPGYRQRMQIEVGGRSREIRVKVLRKTGPDDEMTVSLNYQPGSGMGFDEVDISGVCNIHGNGTIEIFPGGTPLVDVTVKFDQPDQYSWPPGGPYYAIQSRKGPAPDGQCTLKPKDWAWPDDPPAIDASSGYLQFKMPVKSGQNAYYQLNYAAVEDPYPHCVDPEIINH